MQAAHWTALFGLVLGAWAVLYAMAIPADLRSASRLFGADFWAALCTVTPDLAGYGRVAMMWALMATAMMLPTVLPAFATYDDLGSSGAATRPVALWGGYLAVWLGFAVLAAGLQMALFQLDLVSGFGDSRSIWLSAGLLAVAGAYQFSPLKRACLNKCRAPLTFFLAHWQDGAWRMGLRLGAACLGCCWALMLLAFVGGVMSLGFMGLATLIMTLEKLPRFGRWLDRPLGVALLAGAAGLALGAL
jgi:predicted metal-binding membrane protein